MILNRRKHHTSRPELNLAAMIDVVFLLLIFFMCTTSFRAREEKLSAQVPRYRTAVAAREDFEPVRVALHLEGAKLVILCDQQLCVTFDDLLHELQARRKVADIPAIISGTEDVPFEYMVKAMDMCYQADLSQVAFSTQDKTP